MKTALDWLEQDLPVLGRHPLFAGMEKETMRDALRMLRAEGSRCPRGQMIHAAGRPMDRFGMVLEGMVQVCTDDIEGNRMIMAEVPPGAAFGESLCFLGVMDSPVYAWTVEDSRILWLSPEEIFASPEKPLKYDLRKRFTAALAIKNLTMNNRIQVLSRLTLRDRLTAYFTELSAAQGSTEISLPMNREDTAVYIGANRSALSRELARMKKDGLIDYYRETVRILR